LILSRQQVAQPQGVSAAHNSASRNVLPDLEDANYLAAARRQVRFADFGRKLLTRCDHETHLLWKDEATVAEISRDYNCVQIVASPEFAVRGMMKALKKIGEVTS
jgi:hypothetical protein